MTYLALAALVVVPAAVVAVLAGRRGGSRWWTTTALTIAVLILLTIVFDSLMIYADLFRYDEAHLAGVFLLLAPIEDLAWPVVAGLLLPALWELLGPAAAREPGRPGPEQR